MAEWLIDVAVVAEPYFVPPTGNWVGDQDGLVAIASSRTLRVPPLTVIKRGRGYVAVRWRDYVLIGVYFSPNKILADFEEFLGGLETLIVQIQTRHVLVLGDLNAKSTAWGSPKTDARGEVLEEFDVSPSPEHPDRRRPRKSAPRWVLGSRNKEVLVEAAIVQSWLAPLEPAEVEGEAEWFRDAPDFSRPSITIRGDALIRS
ncbi:uncharacterized protein [Epargyreus clarus]|uniref:uncharacterized protein n=1 Tax=Epargyreus clarus TaxID=520877 RepID=UPI003C2CA5FA